MYLVDSHCHLDMLDLAAHGELSKALEHAKAHDVGHMLCVCISLEKFPAMLEIAKAYPQVSASVGLHPNEETSEEPHVEDLVMLAEDPKVVAIGETGLDYFRSEGELEWQRNRFREHIRAAKQVNKPLIIHMRKATDDTLAIMREENATSVGGVMHCFTEDWATAKKALDLGFYISFSGIVTFKNALDIQNAAKQVPLDRMLLETDAPYLAPIPYRGKSNEPAYVRYTAEFIAQLRNITLDEVAENTTRNFFHLFKEAKQNV
jgi:TatD DNase family protein